MADTLDLTGEIASAVDGALERGRSLVLGFVDAQGYPITSFRGSTHVHSPQQLAIWARKADDGFAKAIADHPQVTLVYYDRSGPGPFYLSFRGRAHVDPSANDVVYAKMPEREREADAERHGVAVLIDVESVQGASADGALLMER